MPKINGEEISEKKLAMQLVESFLEDMFRWEESRMRIAKRLSPEERQKVDEEISRLHYKIHVQCDIPSELLEGGPMPKELVDEKLGIERVRKFVTLHGPEGQSVLDAWNDIDPIECFYGNEVNPDEYLSYAKRFMLQFDKHIELHPDYTIEDITEIVRRSFHVTQVTKKNVFMDLGVIDLIAGRIFVSFKGIEL